MVCVLGGVYTDVEKTLIELQRSTTVQETRSEFQVAMQHKFIHEVERLTRRSVLAFISNSHVGPDLEIELFMLGPPAPGDPVRDGDSDAATPAPAEPEPAEDEQQQQHDDEDGEHERGPAFRLVGPGLPERPAA